MKKIVTTLKEKGFVVEVTGIDNDEKSVRDARSVFSNGKIIQGDFLNNDLDGKFDVFSFNQSIYYFHNKNSVIEKCLKNLAEGGLLICICWSKEDKLFQFHKSVFGKWTLGAFTSENFKELVSKDKKIDVVYNKLFKGKINFKLWKDQKNLEKNLYVISRIPVSGAISESNLEIAKMLIDKQKDNEIRINGVVIAKKSYNIPDFTREKIESLLKERFPKYNKEVAKIKGDLEALFMGSWEKETEYLSDYIDSGRVLEICCAAGLKSIILAKKHKVVAIDINEDRLNAAKDNALLFRVNQNVEFKNINAENFNELKELGNFDAIYVDVDWRENLSHPM
ncbi:class I SAM-dependent methyltransferase, partial [Candidatus Woesearchaeota archaeon]|nr:class I SAM-dependent methyltransferase [Candidatus Woesearchaeota archaeon]